MKKYLIDTNILIYYFADTTVSPKENEHIDSPLFYKQRLR